MPASVGSAAATACTKAAQMRGSPARDDVVDDRPAHVVPEAHGLAARAVPHVRGPERLGQRPELVAAWPPPRAAPGDERALGRLGDPLGQESPGPLAAAEPADRVRVRQLVRQHRAGRDAGVAQPRPHDADVPDVPALLRHAERRIGEVDQPRRGGLDGQGVAHVLRRAVDRDDDGRAGVHTEGDEPGAGAVGRGEHGPRAGARPAVGEDDEAGALQHDRVVQRHQVPAPQVLRGAVAGDHRAVGGVGERQVPHHREPVRRPRVAELPAADDAVDARGPVQRRDGEGERPPRQPRERVVDLGEARRAAAEDAVARRRGATTREAGAVAVAQRLGGLRELVAREPSVRCRRAAAPSSDAPGQLQEPSRNGSAHAARTAAATALRRAAARAPGPARPLRASPPARRRGHHTARPRAGAGARVMRPL